MSNRRTPRIDKNPQSDDRLLRSFRRMQRTLSDVQGISDAPQDGSLYARRGGGWAGFVPGIAEAPNNGTIYVRQGELWVPIPAYIEDAPGDDKTYGRKNGAWVEVTAGSSGSGPAAPDGLIATPIDSGRVDLAWTNHSTDETNFRVQRSTDGTTWATIALLPPGASTYSDTTVYRATTFSYRVQALGLLGNSAFCTPANATVPDWPAPKNWYASALSGGSWRVDTDMNGGCRFTLSCNVRVTRLGRYYSTGDSRTHPIYLWDNATPGTPIAQGVISPVSLRDPAGFKWVDLATPVLLTAGTTYTLGVQEYRASDQWDSFWDASTFMVPGLLSSMQAVYNSGICDGTLSVYTYAGKTMWGRPALWYCGDI